MIGYLRCIILVLWTLKCKDSRFKAKLDYLVRSVWKNKGTNSLKPAREWGQWARLYKKWGLEEVEKDS